MKEVWWQKIKHTNRLLNIALMNTVTDTLWGWEQTQLTKQTTRAAAALKGHKWTQLMWSGPLHPVLLLNDALPVWVSHRNALKLPKCAERLTLNLTNLSRFFLFIVFSIPKIQCKTLLGHWHIHKCSTTHIHTQTVP